MGTGFRRTLRRLLGVNIALTVVGVGLVLTFGGTLLGLLVDPRVITGAPAWLKPAKFAMSFALYSFTLIWLLGFVRGHPRLVRLVAGLTALGVAIEMACIATQAARGTTSHYNVATPFDEALWDLMGRMILVIWAMNLLAAILLLRQRLPDPAWAWSLRLGLLLTLVGTAVAFTMTGQGGHSVGVPDGGPGLPLLHWSTVGGDLRAAHFVGIHALQVLPLVGWYLTRRAPDWLGRRHRLLLVCTAALAYLGIVLLLLWQALRGQSVVAPDATTLAAFGGLVGSAALVVVATLLHARQRTVLPAFGD
ncbi:MAG TPA: hypothetical protein VFW96_19225 [Thermomicrobiales bacterium]|nr:hypothetical protein [Thermomicrobiales bacterium]